MFKKSLIIFILILSCVLGYFFFYKKEKLIVDLSMKDTLQVVNSLKVEWEHASLDKDGMCKKLTLVDDQYYQCFPEYMQCLLDNKIIKLKVEGKLVSLSTKSKYTYKQDPRYRFYEFDILIDEKYNPLKVNFIDSCQETYLQQRYYPFMANKRAVTIDWDNFNRNIFVDRFLVQNWEIENWNKLALSKESKSAYSKTKQRNKYTYTHGLSVDEMNSYCNFQGKQVLSAQVYDAVTIHPEDLTDTSVKYMRAPLYPWSRKNTKSVLNKMQRDASYRIGEKEKKQLCNRAYSSNCLDYNYISKNSDAITWSGVFNTFGGPFEYLRNPIHPSENLKLSSKYFDWSSKSHQAGVRGYWDTEGNTIRNIAFDPLRTVKDFGEYEIAFRCMRNL